MKTYNDCEWLTFWEITKIQELDEQDIPAIYWDIYKDTDILSVYTMINPSNEQKLFYPLATEEEKGQNDFEMEFCYNTNKYYDWTSTYTTMLKKIEEIISSYYNWYETSISIPVKEDYDDEQEYKEALESFNNTKEEIEEICEDYEHRLEESAKSAYFTDDALHLRIEDFIE